MREHEHQCSLGRFRCEPLVQMLLPNEISNFMQRYFPILTLDPNITDLLAPLGTSGEFNVEQELRRYAEHNEDSPRAASGMSRHTCEI